MSEEEGTAFAKRAICHEALMASIRFGGFFRSDDHVAEAVDLLTIYRGEFEHILDPITVDECLEAMRAHRSAHR